MTRAATIILLGLAASWPVVSLAAAATTGGGSPIVLPPGDPGQIVHQVFDFALTLAGLLAFVMIVWGGVKYAANPGNPSALDDAKDQIFQALLGLLLLVGSVLVLNTINPQIVLSGFGTTTAVSSSPIGVCPGGCPAGQFCSPSAGGCVGCPGQCGNGQVCQLDAGGNPVCTSCPPEIQSTCISPSKCVAQGSNFTCVPHCGDQGTTGWCDGTDVCYMQSDGKTYSCVPNPS